MITSAVGNFKTWDIEGEPKLVHEKNCWELCHDLYIDTNFVKVRRSAKPLRQNKKFNEKIISVANYHHEMHTKLNLN